MVKDDGADLDREGASGTGMDREVACATDERTWQQLLALMPIVSLALDDELRRAMDHTEKHEYTRELDDEHGGVFLCHTKQRFLLY